jgi:hypothetical protein
MGDGTDSHLHLHAPEEEGSSLVRVGRCCARPPAVE